MSDVPPTMVPLPPEEEAAPVGPLLFDSKANPTRPGTVYSVLGSNPDGETAFFLWRPYPDIGPGAVVNGFEAEGLTVRQIVPMPEPDPTIKMRRRVYQ